MTLRWLFPNDLHKSLHVIDVAEPGDTFVSSSRPWLDTLWGASEKIRDLRLEVVIATVSNGMNATLRNCAGFVFIATDGAISFRDVSGPEETTFPLEVDHLRQMFQQSPEQGLRAELVIYP